MPSDGEIVSVRKGDIYYVVNNAGKSILKVYKTASKKTVSIWSSIGVIKYYYTGKGKYGIVDYSTDFYAHYLARLTVTGKKYKVVGEIYSTP